MNIIVDQTFQHNNSGPDFIFPISDTSELIESGLLTAAGSEETRETRAGASKVVANATAGAITSSLRAITIHRIGTRWALLLITSRTAEASITDTTDMLQGIPGGGVGSGGSGSEVLLRPALAIVVTVIGAGGSLASNTIITSEASACACGSVTSTLVGALYDGVEIVRLNDGSNPGLVLGASALGAIGTSPLRKTINAGIAVAVLVERADTMPGA